MPTPGPYAELFHELARRRSCTAIFRRVALHLHSPDSWDWPRRDADSQKNAKTRFDGTAGAAAFAVELRRHLDLAAITDHMRCAFATQVSSQATAENDFAVLPGMEVNFRPEAAPASVRIHLLVILPEGSSQEAFARLFAGLPSIPDDRERRGTEEVTGISLKEWVDRVHRERGVCIGAHVDNSQGVRCHFRKTAHDTLRLFCNSDHEDLERTYPVGQDLKEYLFQSGLDAVEIAKSSDAPHYHWVCHADGTRRCIPTVLTFDAHCIEELARAERVTHIKMTHLGLTGLADALAFPATRIRFPQDLPSVPSPMICGIEIIGGSDCFFEHARLAFTANLNCLIGARGSGKSTIVEALRYVFGYNRTLGELDKLRTQIVDLQIANLTGCLIRVVYRTSAGAERVLEATFDSKSQYATKVYSADGEYLDVADVEACGDFPLRLYGWSEIETLGRSPARQRDLLDRLIPELIPVLKARSRLRDELRDNRAGVVKAIQDVQSAFGKSDGEIRRYKEYTGDFERLNTEEVKTLFAALDLAQAKRAVLAKLSKNIEQQIQRLADPSAFTLVEGMGALLDASDQTLRDWWLGQELSLLGLVSAEQDVQRSLREAIQRLQAFEMLVGQHLASVEASIRSVEQELRTRFAGDASTLRIADLRANAKRRLQHASTLRTNYLQTWQALQDQLKDRGRIAEELIKVQNEVAGIRARHNERAGNVLNSFLPETMRVAIDFRAGGDTDEFGTAVTPFLAAANRYRARNLSQVVATNCSPVHFARLIYTGGIDELEGKSLSNGNTKSELTADDIAKISEATTPTAHDELAEVPVLADGGRRLEGVLDLEETCWDDHETILLNGRPVNEMSPGQRSSAMLPLIALAQNTPLLIDQPEDNLDKRLLGGVLANVLAQLKEKRQIIVCTHDPNIVVGGDAEQVIVMEAMSDRKGSVGSHGSIDDPSIIQSVIDLLEGGKEAFESRNRRYRCQAAQPV
jgi:energy-coupling factor transporter ATP-binding protein EcfA2